MPWRGLELLLRISRATTLSQRRLEGHRRAGSADDIGTHQAAPARRDSTPGVSYGLG
jgi:hypothetical protein